MTPKRRLLTLIFACLCFKKSLLIIIIIIIIITNSRAIICKKARELRHNNFMDQGESILCNFAECAPMPKGIENPEKEELSY